MLGRALRNNIAEENGKGEFARGETNFLRVDLGVSRSGSLPATGATSVHPTIANTLYNLLYRALSGIVSSKCPRDSVSALTNFIDPSLLIVSNRIYANYFHPIIAQLTDIVANELIHFIVLNRLTNR